MLVLAAPILGDHDLHKLKMTSLILFANILMGNFCSIFMKDIYWSSLFFVMVVVSFPDFGVKL